MSLLIVLFIIEPCPFFYFIQQSFEHSENPLLIISILSVVPFPELLERLLEASSVSPILKG